MPIEIKELIVRARIPVALTAGAALFALGLWAAVAHLPEWQRWAIPEESFFAERLIEDFGRAGVEVAPASVRVRLEEPIENPFQNPYRAYDDGASRWLVEQRRPLRVSTTGIGRTVEGLDLNIEATFGLDGLPWEIELSRTSLAEMMSGTWPDELPAPAELLLRPGQSLGEGVPVKFGGASMVFQPVVGAARPEYVSIPARQHVPALGVFRGPGEPRQMADDPGDKLRSVLRQIGVKVLLFLISAALAFWLALRRRIDLANALLLTALAAAVSLVVALVQGRWSLEWIGVAISIVASAVFGFLLWATGESWLRDTAGQPSHALDALRRGRLGPAVGRGLLLGLAAGAAISGVRLAAHAAAAALPWLQQIDASVGLPVFSPGSTPIDDGWHAAGLALLALAVAHRFLPRRWAAPAAVAAAGLFAAAGKVVIGPWGADLVLELVVAAVLVGVWAGGGVLALLVAAVAAPLFTGAAFAAVHPSWLTSLLAGSTLPLAAAAVIGLVSLRRPDSEDVVAAPAFLRRLDEERRLRYEMDLLARMQVGLLPQTIPQPAGWRIAATSMLAHEVGGDFYDFLRTSTTDEGGELWIAAGDVAGHGSSCSIAHAMTKAALASLIAPGRTPGEVLGEVDRVLRTAGASRIFTALALVRLDTRTGRGLLANAGYPYPLLRHPRHLGGPGDGVEEIALAGLPLGTGPPRIYPDRPLELAPGSLVLFSSDGLYESGAPGAEPYGFDRPRGLLAAWQDGPADDLLAHLVADWRQRVGPDGVVDDTTLLVIERLG